MTDTTRHQRTVAWQQRAFALLGKTAESVVPVLLALVVSGLLLAILGSNPLVFYANLLSRSLLEPSGLQDVVIRMAPLLLIAAGLIVAFRASLWNLGVDGQFLLAAAVVAGVGPSMVESLSMPVAMPLLFVFAALVGALWTLVPAVLRARYGMNEIVTTLMMTYIGINLANILVKGPFRTDIGSVARTDTLPLSDQLPNLFGTRVHLGIIVAAAAILVVHFVMTRTPLGMRLHVLGTNPRTTTHIGLKPARLTVLAFAISGALIGMAGAVEILGVWGSFRANWDPGYGLLVIPLVFLARLNALASVIFVAAFSVVLVGGLYATQQANLPSDFLLALVGLILLFMTVTEVVKTRFASGSAYLTSSLAASLRRRKEDGGEKRDDK